MITKIFHPAARRQIRIRVSGANLISSIIKAGKETLFKYNHIPYVTFTKT